MTKAVQDLMVEVERIRDAFHDGLWSGTDAPAVSSPDCELSFVPTGTGATGADALGHFLTDDFARPADLAFRRLSRTGDRWRVVDEATMSFTHDRELPWLLPGVTATHRAAEVDVIIVVSVRRSVVTRYRMLWDQLGLLDQLGVDPAALGRPAGV